jgi:hypothetical protein
MKEISITIKIEDDGKTILNGQAFGVSEVNLIDAALAVSGCIPKSGIIVKEEQDEQFQTIHMNQPQSEFLSDKDRYERDSYFCRAVDIMEDVLKNCKFTPEDIQAVIRLAEYKIRINERNER